MIKNLSKNYFFSNHQSLPTNHQRGQSSIYIVIIIMVIIFAVMFVGGTESLSSGNEASPVTITPSAVTDSGSASPSTSTAPSPTAASPTTSTAPLAWSLEVIPGACESTNKGGLKKAKVTINGSSKGYFAVSQLNGSYYEVFGTAEFSPPNQNYNVPLINDLQFNKKPWKITVYSGGSKNGENWEGGSTQKIYDGQATGC